MIMMLKTKYHGDLKVNEQEALTFDKGIPGFPEEKKFYIMPLSDDGIFLIMQSAQTQSLAFVITNPFHFFKEYDFTIEDSIEKVLDLKSPEEVIVYSILTVQEPFNKTTANLQAPLIINKQTNKAKQVILKDSNYNTKHPIFQGAVLENMKG